MAKSRQVVRASETKSAGRRRKKPTNPIERAVDDLEQLVSDAAEELLSQAGQHAAKQASSVKKTGAARIRGGQERQAAAKKTSATRKQAGQQRQAATKKAVRARRGKTS